MGENPAFFFLDLLFHYDRIFILGSKCICSKNLSLYLCIKVVLSLLHHQKGGVILPNSVAVLCNFGRVYYEKQFCEIILNLGQSFRRKCRLKYFTWSSGGPPVRWSETIFAISKEVNIHVKLYESKTSG